MNKLSLIKLIREEIQRLNEKNDLLQIDKDVRWFMSTIKTRDEYTNTQILKGIIDKYIDGFSDIEQKFISSIKKVLPRTLQKNEYIFLHQLKSPSSIIDKVLNRGKDITKISDLVRGALLFKDKNVMNEFIKDFKRKYSSLIYAYEYKEKGMDKTYGYYGSHHFDLKIDGLVVELQIMPIKLWTYKDAAHKIYDKWRSSPTPIPDIEKQLSKKLFRIGNESIMGKRNYTLTESIRSYVEFIMKKSL